LDCLVTKVLLVLVLSSTIPLFALLIVISHQDGILITNTNILIISILILILIIIVKIKRKGIVIIIRL